MLDKLTWQPGPESPKFVENEVHVWSISLVADDATTVRLMKYLSPDEGHRAARYLSDQHRRRFVVSRGRQREILSRYVHLSASKIEFCYESLGKPGLDEPLADSRIRFNLSNSGELALLAVTLDRDVGIDVERIREMSSMNDFSRRYFAKQECDALAVLSDSQRQVAFFNCWTRKEAILKATGKGISSPLDKVIVTLSPDREARVLSIDDDQEMAAQWWLAELNPLKGYVGAIAMRMRCPRLVCWSHSD